MGFTQEQIKTFRKIVEQTKKPLFLFDDDADGTTSFALLYKKIGAGRGLPVKNGPEVNEQYIRKVQDYDPDMVFILDKPRVSDEFIDAVNVPIVWLDHHEPQDHKQEHLHYYNPRILDDTDNKPTSYWTYDFIGRKEDVWIAMIGVVADWHMPNFVKECRELYPELVPDNTEEFKNFYLHPQLNFFVNLMTFMQKGTMRESLQAVKVFTRIEEPKEILEQTTPQGKYLYKKQDRFTKRFHKLKEEANKEVGEKTLIFVYEAQTSFTKELSNEMLLEHEDKAIIIGRKSDGRIKASLRGAHIDVFSTQQKALEGLDGYGGGHKHACGMSLNEKDWETFVTRYKEQLKQ